MFFVNIFGRFYCFLEYLSEFFHLSMGYFYSLLLYLLYTLLLVYVSEIFLKIFLLKLFMTVILEEVGGGGGV